MNIRSYLYSVATDKRRGFVASLLKSFLLLLSILYGLGLRVVLFLYKCRILKTYKLDCKVISVGNITLGGTGKTPLVQMLAKALAEGGRKVAVLSRGYGGDEPYVLTQNLPGIPVLVGKDRVKTANEAIDKIGVDTLILDDGFQYWRLMRDFDIVAIDTVNPFGNQRLLPRGTLREPIFGLKRSYIYLLTKVDMGRDNLAGIKERLRGINPDALILESVHSPTRLYDIHRAKEIDLNDIRGQKVCLISGIADPDSFEKTVENLGARAVLRFRFPDHYRFREEDIGRIINSCLRSQVNTIITTEKDMVRMKGAIEGYRAGKQEAPISSYELQILVLYIQLKLIGNEKKLIDYLRFR